MAAILMRRARRPGRDLEPYESFVGREEAQKSQRGPDQGHSVLRVLRLFAAKLDREGCPRESAKGENDGEKRTSRTDIQAEYLTHAGCRVH
jgi:hypothetical protein